MPLVVVHVLSSLSQRQPMAASFSFLRYSEMMGQGRRESSLCSSSSALLVMGDFWDVSAFCRISSTLKQLVCGEREKPKREALGGCLLLPPAAAPGAGEMRAQSGVSNGRRSSSAPRAAFSLELEEGVALFLRLFFAWPFEAPLRWAVPPPCPALVSSGNRGGENRRRVVALLVRVGGRQPLTRGGSAAASLGRACHGSR